MLPEGYLEQLRPRYGTKKVRLLYDLFTTNSRPMYDKVVLMSNRGLAVHEKNRVTPHSQERQRTGYYGFKPMCSSSWKSRVLFRILHTV
jgi:hypothetical protein